MLLNNFSIKLFARYGLVNKRQRITQYNMFSFEFSHFMIIININYINNEYINT